MSRSINKPALVALTGGVLLTASAFAATPLVQGYMLGADAAKAAATDAKAAEAKCGANMAKTADGKAAEGGCGAAKTADGKTAEGGCGATMTADGKAAEGGCGANKTVADGKAADTATTADASKPATDGKADDGKGG